jgi:hypothetical protein
MWDTFLKVLGGVGEEVDQLNCCEEGLTRSKFRAQLPCKLGGSGLRSWERVSSYAWFCSVAACSGEDDPNLDEGRKFLGKLGEDAYDLAVESLGGPEADAVTREKLLPVDERDVLMRSNFYKMWPFFGKGGVEDPHYKRTLRRQPTSWQLIS